MTLQKLVWPGLFSVVLAVQAGCSCHRHEQPHPYPAGTYQPYNPTAPNRPVPIAPGSPEILQPQPMAPGGIPTLPPPGSSSGFGGTFTPPGPPTPTPRDLIPPSNVPVDARYFAQPHRIDNSEPPLAPVNPTPTPKVAEPKLLPPDLVDPRPSAKMPLPTDVSASPALPVGIAAFNAVMDNVSTGNKPDTEGLDWLKANGFKTVIHLRKPGTPDSADKDQIEKRGMKYLSLEVSAELMTASLAAEFSRAVAERSNRPLFVYDRDGTLAGAMWFMYFRTVEKMPLADAKTKAVGFGLKATETGEHATLWNAVQDVSRE